MGRFILTGSSVPISKEESHHTGTGRFSWMRMRPMNLYEFLDSNGEVSLRSLFDSLEKIHGTNRTGLDALAFLICRGG